MKNSTLTLYLEINNSNYVFFVCEKDKENNLKISHKIEAPLQGIDQKRISNLDLTFNTIKENIILIEQHCNYTFKEIVLILENFNPTFINLSGFKKLDGSQVLIENITYILNTLKSIVEETELKKTIIHIFNSKFYLDNKKIDNLPIGLFGDNYSHELSFVLMNKNDYKNLKSIFDKCNLNIKKILTKSFIKGVNISNDNKDTETFFQVRLGEKESKIFYFESNSLKSEQNFSFGTDIIIQDISKITSLKIDFIKMILNKIEFKPEISNDELIEKKYFDGYDYIKIKKKLVYEIALARIKEIFELILFKNTNFFYYNKISKNIFLEIESKSNFKCFKEIYKKTFLSNGTFNFNFIDNLSIENMLKSANQLVHFGWKKEAIPISKSKKSLIARIFDAIFG